MGDRRRHPPEEANTVKRQVRRTRDVSSTVTSPSMTGRFLPGGWAGEEHDGRDDPGRPGQRFREGAGAGWSWDLEATVAVR